MTTRECLLTAELLPLFSYAAGELAHRQSLALTTLASAPFVGLPRTVRDLLPSFEFSIAIVQPNAGRQR